MPEEPTRKGRQRSGEADDDGAVHHAVVAGDRVGSRPCLPGRRCAIPAGSAADEKPVERADDGVAHHPGRVGDQHDLERHLRGAEREVARKRADDDRARWRRGSGGMSESMMSNVSATNRLRISSACHWAAWEKGSKVQPAIDAGDPEDRRQRAAQIVDHLPARQSRQPLAAAEDEGQQLPVAARPAVVAGASTA